VLHAGEVSLISSSINGKLVDKATGQPIMGGKSIVALEQTSGGVDRVVMQTTHRMRPAILSFVPFPPALMTWWP
jgi:hypothetical protein